MTPSYERHFIPIRSRILAYIHTPRRLGDNEIFNSPMHQEKTFARFLHLIKERRQPYTNMRPTGINPTSSTPGDTDEPRIPGAPGTATDER